MVTFCLGSARQKREYIKTIPDALLLDNIEVLFCASENGRNYFAYGDVPFSSFCIGDYLRYSRALNPEKVSVDDILAFGLKPEKRLGRLNPVEHRAVQFLERMYAARGRTVIVNLDGARYGKRRLACLQTLLGHCEKAYVFVTDDRFFSRYKAEKTCVRFGKPIGKIRAKFYRARRLASLIGATRVAVM